MMTKILTPPTRVRTVAAAAGLMAAIASAGATSPGVIGTDDRKPVTASGRPWDAIGQVNIGGYRALGQCTGTLVRSTSTSPPRIAS